jgi:hypothetical protein
MQEQPVENLKSSSPDIAGAEASVPLWLLQKDDTPFLCLSFLASALLHGALFIILAATHIFHPFTGDSGQFELVWFSLSAFESQQPTASKITGAGEQVEAPSRSRGVAFTQKGKQTAAHRPGALPPPLLPAAVPVIHSDEPAPDSSVKTRTLPASNAPAPEADAEMVISRFGGKVVEVVDKDSEIPVYRTFSTAQKSPNPMAMVQYLPETGSSAPEKHASLKTVEPPVPKPLDTKAATAVAVPVAQAVAAPAVAVAAPVKKGPAAEESPVSEKTAVAVKRNAPPVAAPQPEVVAEKKKSPAVPDPPRESAGNITITRIVKEYQPATSERAAKVTRKVVVKEQSLQFLQSSSMVRRVAEARPPVRESGVVATGHHRAASDTVPLLKTATEEKRPSFLAPAVVKAPPRPSPPSAQPVEVPKEKPAPAAPKVAPRLDKPNLAVPKPEPVTVRAPERIEPKAKPLSVRSLPTREAREKTPPVPTFPIIESKQPAAVATVSSVKEKATEPAHGKPSSATPEKPRTIFMPPLAGDLKIVITGEEGIKVEAVFREFRKVRRSKPLTRGEARNSRNVTLKMARTKLNVHETVVEITEEGVYDLRVRSANGKPVTAAFVIKVHEKGTGAVTKNLGRRTVADGALLARILMPEGIFWDDESSFSGTLEDSDSVTRFNTETGLVWREFQ